MNTGEIYERGYRRGVADEVRRQERYAWEKLFCVVFAAAFTACTLVWALLHL